MLSKSKINISVILLVVGLGLIPTGLFTKNYLVDQVSSEVSFVLSDLEANVISELETQYLGLGISALLPELQDELIPELDENYVRIIYIPNTLLYLRNLSMPIFTGRVNGSMTSTIITESLYNVSADINNTIYGSLSAQQINASIKQVMISNSTTEIFAREMFFNNYTFQDNYSTSIQGVSEYVTNGTNELNFTATGQQRLLDGYLSSPGLTQDLVNGTGVLGFMEFYNNATIDPLTYNQSMQISYNSTWEQLTALAGYITNYLWATIVPNLIFANYSMTPLEYATLQASELFFNDEDWSNTTNNLTPISGISEFGTGNSNNLSYSTTAQQRILYGNQDSPGILEDLNFGTGVLDFLELYNATSGGSSMQSQYNATFYQLKNVTSYITQHMLGNIVPAQLALEGLTITTAALRDFYSQWANGSIFTGGIYLRNLSPELGDMLKIASAAQKIRSEIPKINSTDEVSDREHFFNNFELTINFTRIDIQGVSQYTTYPPVSRNYTATAQERLLYGYEHAPGILNYYQSGIGLLNWLDFYQKASLNLGDNRTLMEDTYNATWTDQLVPFGQYLQIYILGSVIGQSTQKGLELGVPTISNISMSSSASLWDQANPSGLTSDIGILKWQEAADGNLTRENELKLTFGLSDSQMGLIYNWLYSVMRNILVPIIFILTMPTGTRITTLEYAEIKFYEQWANGTIYSDGMTLYGGLKGFEVGIPLKSNLSLAKSIDFFDTSNELSFISRVGILKWIDAFNGNSTAGSELMSDFGINSAQLDLILNWLFTTFRYTIVPNVTSYYTGNSLAYYANFEFYRQWSDGMLFKNGLNLSSFLNLGTVSGWELGIPIRSYIDEQTSWQLWSVQNKYSLVDFKGISKWFEAQYDQNTYEYLQNYRWSIGFNNYTYSLTDNQMEAIIAWLIKIRDTYVLSVIQLYSNLPVDQYTLGNNIFLGFSIGGSVLTALGVLGVVLEMIRKRR